MSASSHSAPLARFGMLRTIALYKLLKVIILLLAAWGEVQLHDATLLAKILSWASARPHGLEHDLVTRAISWFSGLSEERVHQVRLITLTYAAVFSVEGHRSLDAAPLGRMVDGHHYGLAHSSGAVGIAAPSLDRRGGRDARELPHRRIPLLARVHPAKACAGAARQRLGQGIVK